jgi:type VI secretion system VgrG family protein
MRKFATLDSQHRIGFESKAYGPDTFGVIEFNGEEGLSQLYRFEIQLVSESADIDLEKMLANDVTLKLVNSGVETRYHGMLAEFEQLHQKGGDTFYRAVLVPRLWQLSLYRVCEVYVEKALPDVIKAVLEEAGLTSLDYEIALTGEYTPWSHLCEYQETHFDFLSRLMERDGVYYYFEQGDQREKLIVTDARMRHQKSPGNAVEYVPMSGLVGKADKPTVFTLVCKQKQLPKTMVLMDYNYRKPEVELRSEVTVDNGGRGEVYLYGEHADTLEESKALAEIRAQELRCRKRTFVGESTVNAIASGFLKELTGHFRNDFNQEYLITEVTHEASQEHDMLQSGDAAAGTTAAFYRNTFTAIAKSVQFRPERLTPKPRIHGTMNAVIDAEGSGTAAELDEHGRYKVRVTFDRTKKGDAKASQSVRMATPYAGSDHGMHFPLRKGTEVLLTFIDGDPNRPIIAGAVPNADNPSMVNRDNETHSVVRIRGGMETVIMPNRRTPMAGVGAQAVYLEDTSDDANTGNTALFGTLPWEAANGWQDDATTFNLIGDSDTTDNRAGEGIRALTTMNSVLHVKGATCERYLGDVVTTIVGNNNLTVRGSVYTYIGDPAAATKQNAEIYLAGYRSDITAESGGSDSGNVHSNRFAAMFQWMGDNLSDTRQDDNPPGSSVTYIEGGSRTTIRGTNVSMVLGDQDTTVQSDSFNKYLGRTNNFYAGNTFLWYWGAQETVNFSAQLTMNVGIVSGLNIAAVGQINVGGIATINIAPSLTIDISVKNGIKINETETTLNALNTTLQDLDTKVSGIDTAVNKVSSRVSRVRNAVNSVKATVSDLDSKTNEIKSAVNKVSQVAIDIDSGATSIDMSGIKLIA